MAEISLRHQNDLSHHITQGNAWLAASADGEETAALSYAAFELRLGIERLAVHYWTSLLNRKPEADDLNDIGSFKRIEKRIYELAGHQREIDGHFEFMRIVLGALRIDGSFLTPQIGKLSSYWHDCSELCHVGWPLACSAPEVRKAAFASLTEIVQALSAQVASMGWPVLHDAAFVDLRNRFIRGDASREDVLSYIQRTGLWARAEYPDGKAPHFVGEAVAPTKAEDSK
ncbi:MAG: hypothetical protein KA535_03350 [Azonexus sp.]|nr:hypothetical protein [Azonexus sp.]